MTKKSTLTAAARTQVARTWCNEQRGLHAQQRAAVVRGVSETHNSYCSRHFAGMDPIVPERGQRQVDVVSCVCDVPRDIRTLCGCVCGCAGVWLHSPAVACAARQAAAASSSS